MIGDNRAYDYSVINKGGFFDFFQQNETITLRPDEGIDGRIGAAAIEVTRQRAIMTTVSWSSAESRGPRVRPGTSWSITVKTISFMREAVSTEP